MNENARKWIEALRSGEFEQGSSCLRKDDSYCCLGVACELYRRTTEQGNWRSSGYAPDGGVYEYFITEEERNNIALPKVVQGWLGLFDNCGSYCEGRHDALSARNDAGVSFSRIADIIESEPKGLFADAKAT